VNSIEERVKRIELSIDRLQAALLSKVNEYGRSVKDLGAEMTSLESALGKILSPLVDNVKELGKITEELKSEKESVRRRISKKI
jgi:predicted  nucleic acid-binding Zn-ribbon protein